MSYQYPDLQLSKPVTIRGTLLPLNEACENGWGIPSEDADNFVHETNRRIRSLGIVHLANHESQNIFSAIGAVKQIWRDENYVKFESEIIDQRVLPLIRKGILKFVSASVFSNNVTCSICMKKAMENMTPLHLCPRGYFNVRSPQLQEISSVLSPAFKDAIITSLSEEP